MDHEIMTIFVTCMPNTGGTFTACILSHLSERDRCKITTFTFSAYFMYTFFLTFDT